MDIKQSFAKFKQKLVAEDLNKVTLWIAFGLYIALVIWIIGFKCNVEIILASAEDMRSLPFKYRVRWIPFGWFAEKKTMFSLEYFLNILIYIPMGIYLMLACKQKTWFCVIVFFLSSLVFEVEQYFTGFGGADITDVICNVLGGMIGVLVVLKFHKKVADKTINKANLWVIALSIPVVIFAIVNTIINRHLYVIN